MLRAITLAGLMAMAATTVVQAEAVDQRSLVVRECVLERAGLTYADWTGGRARDAFAKYEAGCQKIASARSYGDFWDGVYKKAGPNWNIYTGKPVQCFTEAASPPGCNS